MALLSECHANIQSVLTVITSDNRQNRLTARQTPLQYRQPWSNMYQNKAWKRTAQLLAAGNHASSLAQKEIEM